MYNSADVTWTLVAAFMVFFMQAGFALCEAGLTRAKNPSYSHEEYDEFLYRDTLLLDRGLRPDVRRHRRADRRV